MQGMKLFLRPIFLAVVPFSWRISYGSCEWLSPGFHPGGTAGGHCDHRSSGGFAVACRATSSRSRSAHAMREQPEAIRSCDSHVSRYVEQDSPLPIRLLSGGQLESCHSHVPRGDSAADGTAA